MLPFYSKERGKSQNYNTNTYISKSYDFFLHNFVIFYMILDISIFYFIITILYSNVLPSLIATVHAYIKLGNGVKFLSV